MVRLSECMEAGNFPTGFGLVVFGELATHCLEEDEDENNFLEGLCPERITLNDDWAEGETQVDIQPANKRPHQAYIYYAPEYLQGKPWTTACTSFTIFSISYKLLTGEFPYIGKVPNELLSSQTGLKYIKKQRKAGELDLSKIPPSLRQMFTKGLALRKTGIKR